MAGLTTTGIIIKDVDEILSDMESEQLANIDPDLNPEADDLLGQLNGIYAAALAECWELLEQIYQAAYPDTASGQALSYIAALTGAIRQPATKATLLVHLEGTESTTVPAGTQAYVDGDPDSLFETTADADIAEEGTPDYVEVTMEAVNPGSGTVAVIADSPLVISTPVGGLDAITIQDNYVAGDDEEVDSDLRTRREQSLALAGSSTVDAIRADMLTVTGVDVCTVFENPTGVTDALGLPPKSIEVLVSSNTSPAYTAQDIVDQILASRPGGTQAFGGLSGTAEDSAGNSYEVFYSEPAEVQTWVELTLSAETDGTYIGDAEVEIAVASWASETLSVGQSVYASDVIAVVTALTGVISVSPSTVLVDDQASPVSTDLILSPRELATIASADVTVTS